MWKKMLVYLSMLGIVFLVTGCYTIEDKETSKTDEAPKTSKIPETNETLKAGIATNEKNLSNNTEEMTETTNYQTKPLEDWDVVAIMETTMGTMKFKLFFDDTPKTVINFIWLAKRWYYNGIVFHRVIRDFMIQWWDPTATWRWWQSIYGKSFEDEFSDKLNNVRWSLSMANAWPGTNWSQFFIVQQDALHLDGRHSVFWHVMEWIEIIDKIAAVHTDQADKPLEDVKITKLEIKKYENNKLVDYPFDIVEELKKLNTE